MADAIRRLLPTGQVLRYVANGVVATAVHYGVLRLLLDVAGLSSAGLANLIAACCGIAVSFVGSRTFVFRRTDEPWLAQARRFLLLYGAIALVHGAFLYVWSDRLHLDANVGFAIALVLQVIGSYFGTKLLVFRS